MSPPAARPPSALGATRFTFPRLSSRKPLLATRKRPNVGSLFSRTFRSWTHPRRGRVAQTYSPEVGLPDRAVRDAAHLAFATLSKWITF
jgi:hypothetical protein